VINSEGVGKLPSGIATSMKATSIPSTLRFALKLASVLNNLMSVYSRWTGYLLSPNLDLPPFIYR
jgi:hypothetical protein